MEKNQLIGTESSTVIYWTKEYGQFRFLKGNRDLDEAKIKRIMKSIENGLEFFKYCPIMVNEQGYVIDGQHRFFVCKKLGLNVYFVVVPDFSLRQVAEMNNNASKWKDRDFMNCYIDTGVEDYKVLADFIERHHINIGTAIGLLSAGYAHAGTEHREVFRNGQFRVNEQAKAERLMNMVHDFNDYCESYTSRSFIEAIETLWESPEYDHAAMLDKLKVHNLTIEQRPTYKEYLQHMEDLFNFRNSKRRRIY